MEIVKGEYLGGKQHPIGEGVSFNLTDQGANFLICFNDMTDEEVNFIENGDAEFRLFYIDEIIMFLAKFGDMPWISSPFHVALANGGHPLNIPELKSNEGIGMTFFGVDAKNSMVKTNIRLVGLSHNFSTKLIEFIDEQKSKKFSEAEYNQKVKDIYSNYKAAQMAEKSQASCRVTKSK